MKRPLFLLITFFCLATVCFAGTTPWVQDCEKIQADVEVTPTTNGSDNGQVRIHVTKGNLQGIRYIFCAATGKVLNETRFESNSLSGLAQGEYFCIVSNADCTKKISFTIK